MFSLEGGLPICVVKGGYDDRQVVFLDDDRRRLLKVKNSIEVDDGVFQQLPNIKIRCMYIFGASGSGKSKYTADVTRCFVKSTAEANVLLFSKIGDDPAFRGINLTKVPIDDDYLKLPMKIESIQPNTLCIFDDVEQITNDNVLNAIHKLQIEILELGRHKNIKIIITNHKLNNKSRNHTQTILTECQSFTFFPQAGIAKGAKTFLKDYLDCDLKTTRAILNIDSRWITLLTQYPQIILSEHLLEFVSELSKDI